MAWPKNLFATDGGLFSDVLKDLTRLADEARKAAASYKPHDSTVTRLAQAAEEVGKSWSGGWAGYHARVYKANFERIAAGEHWDTMWGPDISTSETRGRSWTEYEHSAVVEAILRRAGDPNLEAIENVVSTIGAVFDRVRDEAAAIVAAIKEGDEFLCERSNKLAQLARNDVAASYIAAIAPSELRIADRRARTEGFRVPPHIEMMAKCYERATYAQSCTQLADEIGRTVKYLSTKSKLSKGTSRSSRKSTNMPGPKEPPVSAESEKDTINIPSGDPGRIFIIHGRNTAVLSQLRIWLESLGLHAKGFDELRAELGGSPTIMEIIKKGMTEARGIIALMTPDEVAFLRTDLHREHDSASDKERWQARPNVIFEAGMAFALAGEKRTMILVAGADLFSDVAGIHFLRVPQNPAERELLKKTLSSMGCNVRDNPHHHSRGDFGVTGIDRPRTHSPFEPSTE